jgi:antitoxin HicB
MKTKNIGSTFDSWLREEGIYEPVTAAAIKRVLARQVEAALKGKQFSRADDAPDHLFDPE